MAPSLIKTIEIGPHSIAEYKKIKLTKYKENKKDISFIINEICQEIPNIYEITEVRQYYIEEDKLITDIQYLYSQRVSTLALQRNIKIMKDMTCTNIGMVTFMIPPDRETHEYLKEKRKEYTEQSERLKIYKSKLGEAFVIEKEKKSKKTMDVYTKPNGFRVFRPKNLASITDKIQTKKKSGKYVPPSGRTGADSSTLVIKNIPEHITYDFAKKKLMKLFEGYGGFGKITILRNKNDPDKLAGIAFIDFFTPKSVKKILESNKKFIIENLVLGIEKQKKKKT